MPQFDLTPFTGLMIVGSISFMLALLYARSKHISADQMRAVLMREKLQDYRDYLLTHPIKKTIITGPCYRFFFMSLFKKEENLARYKKDFEEEKLFREKFLSKKNKK